MLFFVTCWSLWLARNHIIFDNKGIDEVHTIELIIIRLAKWYQAKWSDFGISISEAVRQPACMTIQVRQDYLNGSWTKPEAGSMKFNVDGSTLEQSGEAGIGGILRDEMGRTKAVFSMSVGLMDPNCAEFMAIMEAFFLFSESIWCNTSTCLVVETDSANAREWALNPSKIHWKIVDKARVLERLKIKVNKWRIDKIARNINGTADALAKAGVRRNAKLVVFL